MEGPVEWWRRRGGANREGGAKKDRHRRVTARPFRENVSAKIATHP